jgi:hypothetical protein
MSTLQDLFNTVVNFAFKVRSNGAKGDVAWEKLKPFLPEGEQICGGLGWKIERVTTNDIPMACLREIYDYVHDVLQMKGGDEDINPDGKKPEKWENQHFFLQLIRIPLKYQPLELRRLCQIAYNIGQLKAVYDDEIYRKDVKAYYEKNNLKDLSSYVDLSSCHDLKNYSDIITKINEITKIEEIVLKGGNFNYYAKYLKYKNKYLIYKNNLLSK